MIAWQFTVKIKATAWHEFLYTKSDAVSSTWIDTLFRDTTTYYSNTSKYMSLRPMAGSVQKVFRSRFEEMCFKLVRKTRANCVATELSMASLYFNLSKSLSWKIYIDVAIFWTWTKTSRCICPHPIVNLTSFSNNNNNNTPYHHLNPISWKTGNMMLFVY